MLKGLIMSKKLSTRILTVVLAVAVPMSGMGAAGAQPHVAPSATAMTELRNAPKDQDLADQAADVTKALELINSIPDEVLAQGDAATQQWLAEHPVSTTTTRASVWGCTAAITLFLGTNLVSAAKLLKIKKLIKALGGVKEAVQLMWGASFSYEKMQAAGGALAALAGEFFGVTSIREKCFN